MPKYGDKNYWEERYKNDQTTFDWLENYEVLKDIIYKLSLNKETSRIINLGCGNSEFAEKMYDDGYKNIVNIDISKNVIKTMQDRNKSRNIMTFQVMDVRDLKYENNYFDLAVDKSTIDAILCGEDSFINAAKMLKEVQRVLKVGGYYMMVSYGAPDSRLLHLNRKFEKFKIEIVKIEKDYEEEDGFDKHHYVYLCQKLEGADEQSKLNFDKTIEELVTQQKIEEEISEGDEVDDNKNNDVKEEIKDENKKELINVINEK